MNIMRRGALVQIQAACCHFISPELEKVAGRRDFLKYVIQAKDLEEAAKFFDRLRNNIKWQDSVFAGFQVSDTSGK